MRELRQKNKGGICRQENEIHKTNEDVHQLTGIDNSPADNNVPEVIGIATSKWTMT